MFQKPGPTIKVNRVGKGFAILYLLGLGVHPGIIAGAILGSLVLLVCVAVGK